MKFIFAFILLFAFPGNANSSVWVSLDVKRMTGIKDGNSTISIGDGNSYATYQQKGADLLDVEDMELGEKRTVKLTSEQIEMYSRKFQEVEHKRIMERKEQEREDFMREHLRRVCSISSILRPLPAATRNAFCNSASADLNCCCSFISSIRAR